jgi:NAD-dependent dihydropyrimidine dehydrogenase PreA subunit
VTYVITEPCIGTKDQSCVEVCPVDCIYDAGDHFMINPEECIDCGACEPECPVEAIYPEDALPDKWNAFVEINYAYPDGATIDRLVDQVKPPEPAA